MILIENRKTKFESHKSGTFFFSFLKFNVQIKGNTASSSGLYVRIYYYTGDLPAGKTHVSNSASHTLVQEDTAGDSGWYENEVGRHVRLKSTKTYPDWRMTLRKISKE